MPDVELVFVLGETDCQIHPADRRSSYSCQKWEITEDRNALMIHKEKQPSRTKNWKNHLENIHMKIAEEEKENHDLLILPLLDIYSHLPEKILAFLNWVTHERNSSYVMKVDDDTFVNIPILDFLTKSTNIADPTWWSHFHHHRSVPVYGKWAEVDYPSLTYPTFPSGAGYLMTGSLARAVAAAGSYLTSYGGEDVSMGIWVSSVAGGARTVDAPCWLPYSECPETILVPQLSVAQMMAVWKKWTVSDAKDVFLRIN
ncbi:UDP-GalNAc:beta-1,3-N-acetylgalactosaminyltransferase 2-like [Panulirus ornatus]|uniref:UDP-GalNAc:beta-1, 3-N-acetylgalactosaminyltransferase 2-like n=1 Tax=Panulirus ornatus TaxID=150431 RepID=UPI003A894442